MTQWTFLTNHAHVLLCVAREEDSRLRHIADCVGITERATHRIICDLVEAGYLEKHRLGRRSYYEVNLERALRHPLEGDHQLGDLLAPFLRRKRDGRGPDESGTPQTPPPSSKNTPVPA